MSNLSRRKVLKLGALFAGIGVLPSCDEKDIAIEVKKLKGYELPVEQFDGVLILSKYLKSNIKLEEQLDAYVLTDEFKQAHKNLMLIDKNKIFDVIESDFDKGLTVDFKGFVFSTTEVAFYVYHKGSI